MGLPLLPDSALKSMRVMFVTPCYISGVSMNYVASIFCLTLDSAHFGLLHSEALPERAQVDSVVCRDVPCDRCGQDE